MNTVDSNLNATAGEQYCTMRSQLWAAIEDEIALSDCDIYRWVVFMISYISMGIYHFSGMPLFLNFNSKFECCYLLKEINIYNFTL